jgi:hypothetical protein
METNSHPENGAGLASTPLPTECVFLRTPFPECYCMGITSLKISRILKYCSGEFTSCKIYRNRVEGKSEWQAA